MNILDYILNKIGNDIEVILKKDLVTFRSDDAFEQIPPVVYLTQSDHRVLSVGIVPENSENYIRINLFDGEVFNSENFDKSRILELFFEYGIHKIMGRLAFVRPRVSLVFGDRIWKVFGGYERMVLKDAIVNAGAREVVFRSIPMLG